MIANETTLHKIPIDTETNDIGHRSAFNNEQSPYRIACIHYVHYVKTAQIHKY